MDGKRATWIGVAGACVLVAAACGARAGEGEAQAMPAGLDASDFQTRQQTMRKLLAGPAIADKQLKRWLQQAESPEQRHRLLTIARHHTIRKVRRKRFEAGANANNRPPNQRGGSIGISHQWVPAQNIPGRSQAGVLVVHTIVGFPGHAHLEAGDLVLKLNGQKLAEGMNAGGFARMIKQHGQGQAMTMTVLRDGEKREVRFKLAAAAALSQMYEVRDGLQLRADFREPWLRRRQSLVQGLDLSRSLSLSEPGAGNEK